MAGARRRRRLRRHRYRRRSRDRPRRPGRALADQPIAWYASGPWVAGLHSHSCCGARQRHARPRQSTTHRHVPTCSRIARSTASLRGRNRWRGSACDNPPDDESARIAPHPRSATPSVQRPTRAGEGPAACAGTGSAVGSHADPTQPRHPADRSHRARPGHPRRLASASSTSGQAGSGRSRVRSDRRSRTSSRA